MRLACATLVLGLCFSVGNARAAGKSARRDTKQDPKDDAKEYARRGNVAYNLGNYLEAAENYEQAYRLVQDPNLLFNIAQSYRQCDKPEKALAAYKGFLRTAPTHHKNRKDAEDHIAELEALLAKPQREPAVISASPGTPGGVTQNAPGKPEDFNPFNATQRDYSERTQPTPKATSDSASGEPEPGTLQALAPTIGGDVTLANQNGITGGRRAAFGAFARSTHKGRSYELGYFRKTLFAPDPHYQTSALYFRFTSAPSPESGSAWWVQVGALGEHGDMHVAGGLNWKFLGFGGRVETVADPDLCGSNTGDSKATYVVPEVTVTLPVIPRLQARALGQVRHALFSSTDCVFHPSLSTVDVMGDWTPVDRAVITAGVGFYQYFNDDKVPIGPWPMDHSSTAGHGHIGLRYAWAEHLTLLLHYRRIIYSSGVNEIFAGLEVGLGAR